MIPDMALLHSCCCWHSLRKGSYASAIYTMVYFGGTLIIMSVFLHEEIMATNGNGTTVETTVLEPESITPGTLAYSFLTVGCSSFGLFTSTLLVYGLYHDKSLFLLPWILAVVVASVVEVTHVFYLIILELSNFNPMTTILFTLDFFLISFNVYSLLCVVSQYQEYRAGRGTARHQRFSPVRYIAQGCDSGCIPGPNRPRGLSLIPTPPGASTPPLPTSTMQPPGPGASSQSSPSACLLDAGSPFCRSPSIRKHVQFGEPNQQLGVSSGEFVVPNSGAGVNNAPAMGRILEKGTPLQRTALQEESSFDTSEEAEKCAETAIDVTTSRGTPEQSVCNQQTTNCSSQEDSLIV